jgi:hypothetical protein
MARLAALLLIGQLCATSAQARCPFAHLFGGDLAAGDDFHGRRLLQGPRNPQGGPGPRLGGPAGGGSIPQPGQAGPQQPRLKPPVSQQPRLQPPAPQTTAGPAPQQPPAACDLAALIAAGPYLPAGPSSQGEVDARVKSIAWTVITASAGAGAPGVGTPGRPNTTLPLGGLLRMAFHDAGTYSR